MVELIASIRRKQEERKKREAQVTREAEEVRRRIHEMIAELEANRLRE